MVNYLAKYVARLATVGHPLYEVLKSKAAWTWGPTQQGPFQQIKELLTTSPTLGSSLTYYDVNTATAVSADASGYGIVVCCYSSTGKTGSLWHAPPLSLQAKEVFYANHLFSHPIDLASRSLLKEQHSADE